MKKQEYLVRKYNDEGCNYDNRCYEKYADAWADTAKNDEMFVCKKDTVYFGANGWTVDSEDIIRMVTR